MIEPQTADLHPEAARAFLKFGFDEADKARMHDLAVRNQEAGLSDAEKAQLENYVLVGHLLALIHSKARRSLAARGGSWDRLVMDESLARRICRGAGATCSS